MSYEDRKTLDAGFTCRARKWAAGEWLLSGAWPRPRKLVRRAGRVLELADFRDDGVRVLRLKRLPADVRRVEVSNVA